LKIGYILELLSAANLSGRRQSKIMNWEMISAVGQMLGAIGVVISIVDLPRDDRFDDALE